MNGTIIFYYHLEDNIRGLGLVSPPAQSVNPYNNSLFVPVSSTGIVHENVKMGSDGESDQASGTSSDEVQSPVRVRMRNNHHRRISNEVLEAKDAHLLHTHLLLHQPYCTHTSKQTEAHLDTTLFIEI